MDKDKEWDWEIRARENWFSWHLTEIWQYKDLLFRLVRRDLLANYQQTILGPLWILFQPILTTLVYFVIFGRIAKISTDGAPPILFYLPGIIMWSFFSDCLTGAMYVFLNNAAVFSKVYFPRLIMPLSNIIAQSVRLGIQLVLFLAVYLYYFMDHRVPPPSSAALLLPFLVLLTAAFSLGSGLIISVLTARYRDLDYALQFILRLFMFATPVVYPTSIVPDKYKFLFWLNPLTPVIETFRTSFLIHDGNIYYGYLLVSLLSVSIILLAGIALFKKHELKVMDII